MANGIFNISRGYIGYRTADADGLSAANSRLVSIIWSLIETEDLLNNRTDVADIQIEAANDEADATNYARVEIAAAGVTYSVDDTANTAKTVMDADQTMTSVANDDTNGGWLKLTMCWDGDNATGTDANILPLTYHDFVVTPNGGDITLDFDQTNGFWGSS